MSVVRLNHHLEKKNRCANTNLLCSCPVITDTSLLRCQAREGICSMRSPAHKFSEDLVEWWWLFGDT